VAPSDMPDLPLDPSADIQMNCRMCGEPSVRSARETDRRGPARYIYQCEEHGWFRWTIEMTSPPPPAAPLDLFSILRIDRRGRPRDRRKDDKAEARPTG
jgi:hypothetical protein